MAGQAGFAVPPSTTKNTVIEYTSLEYTSINNNSIECINTSAEYTSIEHPNIESTNTFDTSVECINVQHIIAEYKVCQAASLSYKKATCVRSKAASIPKDPLTLISNMMK